MSSIKIKTSEGYKKIPLNLTNIEVENSLNSESTIKALSAKQGKILGQGLEEISKNPSPLVQDMSQAISPAVGFVLEPGIYYKFGVRDEIEFTIQDPAEGHSRLPEYSFEVTSGDSGLTVIMPAELEWIVEPYDLKAGTTYQVSIVSGLAGILAPGMSFVDEDGKIVNLSDYAKRTELDEIAGKVPGKRTALTPMFEARGAVFNDTTGYYELNEIVDIDEVEIMDIYNASVWKIMPDRSEERRGGKECVSTCRAWR